MCHLELVFEIGDGPKPLYQDVGTHFSSEIDDKTFDNRDRNIRQVPRRLLQEVHAILHAKKNLLPICIVHYAYNDGVEHGRTPSDDIQMSHGDRVVRARTKHGVQ